MSTSLCTSAYPVMMKAATVEKLKDYVNSGGTLICEGLPAYFGDHGHVGTTQPNYGLDELFGCSESYVEFLADIHDDLQFQVNGSAVYGRYFFQQYAVKAAGKAIGHWPDGKVAAVQSRSGKGQTVLMGSFPGGGYYLHHGAGTRVLFASFLKLAGIAPHLTVNDNHVQARMHQGEGGTNLWITNPTREPKAVKVTLQESFGRFASGEDRWGGSKVAVTGRDIAVTVPARDAAVIALR